MSRIQRLPLAIANQIAAGEVIERPASVVKELVENALDAGASRVRIRAREGGRWLEVTDDGSGMDPEDAVLAFERFATSKLRTSEDLWTLRTMGFRGEALPSIASVSRLTCTTRALGSQDGIEVRIEGGHEPVVHPAGCPEGTRIEVADLFFNTPARRKFLRADSTELSQIGEVVTGLALAHPGVRFSLTLEQREVFDTAGCRNLRDVIRVLWGTEWADRMLEVDTETSTGRVHGLLAPPEWLRRDRHRQFWVLNGRNIRHPSLARGLEEALAVHVPQGRHSQFVLHLEVDPERVDVNVHPTKREVRLADGQSVYWLVKEAITRSLLLDRGVEPTPGMGATTGTHERSQGGQAPWPASGTAGRGMPRQDIDPERSAAALDLFRPAPAGERVDAARPYQPMLGGSPELARAVHRPDDFPWDGLRIVGQLDRTFILLEHPDGLYMLDQHNAHERYLYEQMKPAEVKSQELLMPRVMQLRPETSEALRDHATRLNDLGYRIEPMDETTWAIRAVPAILSLEQAEATVHELLGDAAEARFVSPANREDRWRITIACHAATRAGDVLDPEQMKKVVGYWRACQQPFTCPHGRPTGFLIPRNELKRRVLR
ncbi:MAG: DNA mismatch repair endonuclease MutL [bacterium]|nr:DNA mismatch repair endonuclease MutL [bacterium]